MKPISLSTASRAAAALKVAARSADVDNDGNLSRSELKAADTVVGAAAGRALRAYAAQYRVDVARDPELSPKERAQAKNSMDVLVIDYSVRAAITQLKRIDSYRGTQNPRRPANTPDGFVTDIEIKNYGPTKGALQREAGPLARFTLDFGG